MDSLLKIKDNLNNMEICEGIQQPLDSGNVWLCGEDEFHDSVGESSKRNDGSNKKRSKPNCTPLSIYDQETLVKGDGKVNGEKRSVSESTMEEEVGRERLKKHRVEVAGRVQIPDIWGQEELLKDWIDCSAFDACLVPKGIMSARDALVHEGRRASTGRLRVANRC